MATLNKISDLQITTAKSFAGLVTEGSLAAIHQIEPQLASNIVTKVFSMMRYEGLIEILNRYPTVTMDTDIEYRWYMKGDDRKPITIVSYSASDSTRPGVGNTTFDLELEENYYQASDFLIFDNRDHGVRILDAGRANGTNWIYTVEHMKPDAGYYVPPMYLAAGRQVSKKSSPVTNTLNSEFGGVQFVSHFQMENSFSTIAKEQVVPGNMHNRPLLITAKLPNGKETTVWTTYYEMMADWQWEMEKANSLMFDETNKVAATGTYVNKGKNGYAIKQGAGLRQQISPSYKFYYTNFTIDYLLEVLTTLSINILPEDHREFILLTGERGMIQFHKAIENKVALFMPLGNEKRLGGAGQNLSFGGQYRKYEGPQGITVTVMNMQQYNDPIDNRIPHPDGGQTENYRYTIMNVGTSDGQPNIQKVVPKNRTELRAYLTGLTGPMGPANNVMVSQGIDGYKIMRQTTHGIMLRNPMSCAELIYSAVE